jgi:hypothetical protein
MTAGLPGAGIGGLFYLISALLMPVRSLYRALTGRGEPRWALALRQAALAAGILAGIWAAGWLLGALLVRGGAGAAGAAMAGGRVGGGASDVPNVVRTGALWFSLGTLAAVLALVRVGRLLVKKPVRQPTAAPRVPTPAAGAPVMVVSHTRRESPSGAFRRLPPRVVPPPRREDSGQFTKVGS